MSASRVAGSAGKANAVKRLERRNEHRNVIAILLERAAVGGLQVPLLEEDAPSMMGWRTNL